MRYADPRVRDFVYNKKKHLFKGVYLDVKPAVTKELNEKKVTEEQQRKVFLAQINSSITECRAALLRRYLQPLRQVRPNRDS